MGHVFGPSGAAARLGIARSTLESKIRGLGIDKNRFAADERSLSRSSCCPAFHQLAKFRSVNTTLIFVDSASCEWPSDCLASPRINAEKTAHGKQGCGDVVFTVSGRLDADNISELSTLLAEESPGRALVMDLKDVVLVDRDVIRFLGARERKASCFATVRLTSANGSRARTSSQTPQVWKTMQ